MRSVFKNTLVRMSVLALVLFCIVTFVSLRLKQNDYEMRADELRAQLDEVTEYRDGLQAQLDRPFNDDYVAEVAHEKLGLRFPQEIIYYSSSDGSN